MDNHFFRKIGKRNFSTLRNQPSVCKKNVILYIRFTSLLLRPTPYNRYTYIFPIVIGYCLWPSLSCVKANSRIMRIYADILLIACFYRISTYTIYVYTYIYQSPTDDDAADDVADDLPGQYQQCPQEKRSFSKQCKQKETKIAQCDVVPYPLRMELCVYIIK